MKELRSFRRVYLASPYTKHPDGRDYAYRWACGALANLTAARVIAYCPIAHWHTASLLDPQGTFKSFTPDDWFRLNKPELDLCDCLVVLNDRDETWKSSEGVKRETEAFSPKPIYLWDALSLTKLS